MDEGMEEDEAYGINQSLEDGLLKMLGNANFCDIVFVCGEAQEEVPALRMLVAARSPTLESMLLTSGMKETTLSHIPLPHLEASTMRICIEFFYTGAIRVNTWLRFLSSMKVISAARFFLVPQLEQLAIHHMRSLCTRMLEEECVRDEFSLVDIATAYTLGVELQDHYRNTGLSSFLSNFKDCIFWNLRSCLKFHEHLSEQALIHLLGYIVDEYLPPVLQYVAFRLVVQWCSCKLLKLSMDDSSINELVINNIFQRFLPYWRDEEFYQHIAMVPTRQDINSDDVNMLKVLKLLADPVASCLKKTSINFSRIPVLILSKIIEPLGLVPRSTLLTTYRLQALRRHDLRWSHASHARHYVISDCELTEISCLSDTFQGFARCGVCVADCSVRFFSWEIAILLPCEQFRVGFCKILPGMSEDRYDDCLLGNDSGSWALNSEGSLFHNLKCITCYCEPLQVRMGLTVGVRLNMTKCSCSFTINGKDLGVAWTDLPGDEYLYPAISLQKPGKVRVQLAVEDWMMNPESLLMLDVTRTTGELLEA